MSIKKALLAIIILAYTSTGRSQTLEDYNTVMHQFQYYLNHQQFDSIFTLFSDKVKQIMPLNKTIENFSKLYAQLGEIKSYNLISQKDSLNSYKVDFRSSTFTLLLALNKENKMETLRFLPYTDSSKREKSNFHLDTKNGTLYGTLATPPGMKKVPVVLIIPGSGPTDRNGNNPLGVKANTYHMIADSLLKEGIASLRYDKRGVEESGSVLKSEDSLTFDDMINDAIGFTKMLKEYWRFTKVIILGHSEGSLIGMEVAKKEKVDGFISVAGIGDRADKIIEKQLKTESKEMSKKATVIFDSLINGYSVKNIDPSLIAIFRPSVQGYMRSWLKYTPKDEIKTLHIPVLILQGTTDIQVGVKEAKKLNKAYPDATLTIIGGMNHILKQAPKDRALNEATYANPDLPLSPGLIPAISQFVKGIK